MNMGRGAQPSFSESWSEVDLESPGVRAGLEPGDRGLRKGWDGKLQRGCLIAACLITFALAVALVVLLPITITKSASPPPARPPPCILCLLPPPVVKHILILELPPPCCPKPAPPPPPPLFFILNTDVHHKTLILQGPLLSLAAPANETGHSGQLILEEPEANLTIFRDPRGYCFLHNSTDPGLRSALRPADSSNLPGNGTETVNGTGTGTNETMEAMGVSEDVMRVSVALEMAALRVVSPVLGDLADLAAQLPAAFCQSNASFWVKPDPEPLPEEKAKEKDVVIFAVPHPNTKALIRQSIYF